MIHIRISRKILVDQASSFEEKFIHIAAVRNVEEQRTGIEAHYNLELGERYNQTLRNTYIKIQIS